MKIPPHVSRPVALPAHQAPAVSTGGPVAKAQGQPDAVFAGTSQGTVTAPLQGSVTVGKTVENTPSGAARKLQKLTDSAGPRRVFASVDLGSSSVKLLVMGQGANGKMHVLEDQRVGANLGKGIGSDGNLPQANQERVLEALRTLLAAAAKHGVPPEDIPLIATAAVRNAPNGEAFMQSIRDGVGLTRARVLTGAQEAQTGYQAALLGLDERKPGRYATLDLGGGSFQLAVGTQDTMEQGASTQVGSNQVQDKLLPASVITAADYARADAALKSQAPMPLAASLLDGRQLVAMGGVSLFLKAQFGRNVIGRDEVEALRQQVGGLPPDQRAAFLLKDVDPSRRAALGVDTPEGALDYATKLPAKLTLLLHIMRTLDLAELHVSSADARHLLIENDLTQAA
jgi:hypothetical protein